MYLIYKHTFPNGKSYIGYTGKCIEKRLVEHINNAKNGMDTKFYKAIRKFGVDSIKSEILIENIEDIDEIKKLEEEYIAEYNTYGRNSNGYNMTKGGDGNSLFGEENGMFGKTHTTKVKRKLSKLASKRTGKKNPWHSSNKTKEELLERANKIAKARRENGTYGSEYQGMYNKNHSEESKRKMSETKKNKPYVTCPHCGLNAKQSSNMTRYHFNNCKQK